MDDRTERRYEALRRRINREYRQAEKELREKMEEFFAKSAERDKKKRQELADGKITMQEYQRWLRGQVFQGKRWQEKIDQAARQLTQVDETATAIVNGERLNVFADNMNYQNGEAERIIGARFDLYDQATVARLLDEQPNLLPPRRVKRSDDIPWYHKLINNCVTQGILQGESVPQIAKRIGEQTGERGRTAMLRNARTAVTGAQNAGRIEAMHQQEQMGIRVQKKWIAAHDARTREAHELLDGQTVDVDAPFQSILGEILFPGDPAAHPANVYNCRCTLGYVYPDYQDTAQEAAQEDARGTEEEVRAEEAENREREQGVVRAPTGAVTNAFIRSIDRRIEPIENKLKNFHESAYRDAKQAKEEREGLEAEVNRLYKLRASLRYPDDDIMQNIRHIDHKHTPEDDVANTNPKWYTVGGTEYSTNCQRCVPAYEMRRRGYDVIASPRDHTKPDPLVADWRNVFENANWIKCPIGNGIEQVKQKMLEWGEGARGEVYVTWKNGVSHVFVAENVGGNVILRDPQTALPIDVAFIETSMTEICRIDNLKPSPLIRQCCMEATR